MPFGNSQSLNASYHIVYLAVGTYPLTGVQASKYHSVVKLAVVSCPPVVEVLIKRPDIKYQLGFSVQNGVVRLRLFPHVHSMFGPIFASEAEGSRFCRIACSIYTLVHRIVSKDSGRHFCYSSSLLQYLPLFRF